MSSGGELCSCGDSPGSMESQEIGGEITRPPDCCHSGGVGIAWGWQSVPGEEARDA